MNSVNSQRCGAQPDQPEIIDESVSATEFSITVPGCVVLLVKIASSEQAHGHGQQCDIHTHMRRSARVLQGLVDGVCEGQRLAVKFPNLKCCLVLDDGLVDLELLEHAQVKAKMPNNRRTCGIGIGTTQVCAG